MEAGSPSTTISAIRNRLRRRGLKFDTHNPEVHCIAQRLIAWDEGNWVVYTGEYEDPPTIRVHPVLGFVVAEVDWRTDFSPGPAQFRVVPLIEDNGTVYPSWRYGTIHAAADFTPEVINRIEENARLRDKLRQQRRASAERRKAEKMKTKMSALIPALAV
jgi:hypothetical protein